VYRRTAPRRRIHNPALQDDFVRKQLVGVQITNRLWEARELPVRYSASGTELAPGRCPLPRAFIVHEEESLVADDRPAQCAAENVRRKAWQPRSAVVEEAVGIQLVVAQEFDTLPWKSLEPLLICAFTMAPAALPNSAGAFRQHFHFFERIHVQLISIGYRWNR
jgi:hypothetical protein